MKNRSAKPILYAFSILPLLIGIKMFLYHYYKSTGRDDFIANIADAGPWLLGGTDLALCVGLGCFYLALNLLVRSRKFLFYFAWTLNSAVLIYSFVNITVIRQYGNHLSPLHLKFVGKASVFASSVTSFIDIYRLLGVLTVVLALWLFMRWQESLARLPAKIWVPVSAIVVGGSLLWAFAGYKAYKGVYVGGLKRNSVVHFAQDYAKTLLFHKKRSSDIDLSKYSGHSFELTADKSKNFSPTMKPQRKYDKFIVVVLESTSASVINAETSPFIESLKKESIVFDNHFANSQNSLLSNHAIFYSRLRGADFIHSNNPLLTKSVLQVFDENQIPSDIFQSGFFDYDGIDRLWRNKGARGLTDGLEINRAEQRSGWAWGALEEDTVADLLARFRQYKPNESFTLVYRPVFPHHPYYTPMKSKPFEDVSWRGKYSNSVYYTDQNVKRLVEEVRASNHGSDTVVVIVADHGETVTQDLAGHGLKFSADELRVLFLVNLPERLQLKVGTVTSHLDVAPTLAGLAGADRPDGWMGRNLLASEVPDHRVFVVPGAGGDSGIIENDVGVRFNINTGNLEFFRPSNEFLPLSESSIPDPRKKDLETEIRIFSELGWSNSLDRFF